jgi:isochorismate hydrolase
VRSVLIVGFYAHMCVSTSVREALIRGLDVFIDPEATGARDLEHPVLGKQSADEVRRSALLQLTNMGAQVLAKSEKGEKQKRELQACHALRLNCLWPYSERRALRGSKHEDH